MIKNLKGLTFKGFSFTTFFDEEIVLIETEKGTFALQGTNTNSTISFDPRPYNVGGIIEGIKFEVVTNQLAVIMLATTNDIFVFKLKVPYPEVLNANNLFSLK